MRIRLLVRRVALVGAAVAAVSALASPAYADDPTGVWTSPPKVTDGSLLSALVQCGAHRGTHLSVALFTVDPPGVDGDAFERAEVTASLDDFCLPGVRADVTITDDAVVNGANGALWDRYTAKDSQRCRDCRERTAVANNRVAVFGADALGVRPADHVVVKAEGFVWFASAGQWERYACDQYELLVQPETGEYRTITSGPCGDPVLLQGDGT